LIDSDLATGREGVRRNDGFSPKNSSFSVDGDSDVLLYAILIEPELGGHDLRFERILEENRKRH